MSFFELVLIAIGLSADAFAVAVCNGLSMKKLTLKKALIVGLYFGIFQAAMPLAGYFLGAAFAEYITAFDHWIVFALLLILGAKMIKESLSKKTEDSCEEQPLTPKKMLPLALATSIDALAVGITFAFLQVKIAPAVTLIGITTLLLSMLGTLIGNRFGTKFKSKAELFGGIILILIGVKILLEHLGVISF